jgi:hypothetical protein
VHLGYRLRRTCRRFQIAGQNDNAWFLFGSIGHILKALLLLLLLLHQAEQVSGWYIHGEHHE